MDTRHTIPAPYTAHELATVRRMYEQGYTVTEIATTINRTYRSVANKIQVSKDEQGWVRQVRGSPFQPSIRPVASYAQPDGPTLVQALAPEQSADEPEDQFVHRMLESATRSLERANAQRYATIRIMSADPVAISISSDWHVASSGTDLTGLLAYADFVAHTDGVYAIAVGDLHDNAIKHKGGSVAGIVDELRMLDHLVGRFKGKLLGTTSGNHDDWSKVFAGVDNLRLLAKRHGIHYAPDELLWTVEIVDPVTRQVTGTYRLYTRHQWRRGSSLNPGHACWTWMQEEGPNWNEYPDVLAIGHNHVSVVESRQFASRDIWALRMGTFQQDSAFARAKGFGRYRSTCPTVVLPLSREHGRVQCFADPQDAVIYMRGLT